MVAFYIYMFVFFYIFLACFVLSFYEPNKKVFYWKYQRFCCRKMNTNRRPELFSIIWHHYLRYMKDMRNQLKVATKCCLFQLAVYFQSEYLISVIQVRSGHKKLYFVFRNSSRLR